MYFTQWKPHLPPQQGQPGFWGISSFRTFCFTMAMVIWFWAITLAAVALGRVFIILSSFSQSGLTKTRKMSEFRNRFEVFFSTSVACLLWLFLFFPVLGELSSGSVLPRGYQLWSCLSCCPNVSHSPCTIYQCLRWWSCGHFQHIVLILAFVGVWFAGELTLTGFCVRRFR